MKRYLFIIVWIPLLCTCQTAKKAAMEAHNKPLIETPWEVCAINGQALPKNSMTTPFIVFDTLGNYRGDFGCNKFFGTFYEKRKQKLELTYAGATKRLCQYMETERLLSKVIRSDKLTYHITGDTLWLYSNNEEIIRFTATKRDSITNYE